jgi:hypothetical protein
MKSLDIWRPVFQALDAWHATGLRAPLWLRDDDAVEPTPALERLIVLTTRHSIPLALAVVPATAGKALAQKVRTATHLTPLVHGWAHRNHAPEGEKKQEFGPHRPVEAMHRELSLAVSRMREVFAEQMVPIFVPPWNRIAAELVPTLGELGYAALSTFGVALDDTRGIPEINTHIDIIDFRGTRRCREHGVLAREIAVALAHSLSHGRYPVGILSHHLVHDELAFDFLEALFSLASQESWLPAATLIERRAGLAG